MCGERGGRRRERRAGPARGRGCGAPSGAGGSGATQLAGAGQGHGARSHPLSCELSRAPVLLWTCVPSWKNEAVEPKRMPLGCALALRVSDCAQSTDPRGPPPPPPAQGLGDTGLPGLCVRHPSCWLCQSVHGGSRVTTRRCPAPARHLPHVGVWKPGRRGPGARPCLLATCPPAGAPPAPRSPHLLSAFGKRQPCRNSDLGFLPGSSAQLL